MFRDQSRSSTSGGFELKGRRRSPRRNYPVYSNSTTVQSSPKRRPGTEICHRRKNILERRSFRRYFLKPLVIVKLSVRVLGFGDAIGDQDESVARFQMDVIPFVGRIRQQSHRQIPMLRAALPGAGNQQWRYMPAVYVLQFPVLPNLGDDDRRIFFAQVLLRKEPVH